jgi:hypothetical protein
MSVIRMLGTNVCQIEPAKNSSGVPLDAQES